ncbi:MAG: glycosyltransferase family 4 protein [Nanoarchaeota archaeon]
MNILIIHEIDWIKKVPFEPQHLAELFSLKNNDVFVVYCAAPDFSQIISGLFTTITKNYSRLYDHASITLIRPRSILVKGLNRLTHFLTCKKIIKKIISENNIDIILLYGVATNGIQSIQLSNEMHIPLVFRCLDVAHELVKIPILHNLTKKYEKLVINNATKVLSTTPELVRYTKEMGANENSDYFPLGINPQFFKPVLKIQSLMQQLGLKNSDKVIGFIGTVYPFAGLDFLINNFHILKNEIQGIKFLIIGGGPDFVRIKSLIKQLHLGNDIIMTGFVKQEKLFEYVSLFDICVNPFVVNNITDRIIPTKILEYMACGKPVLSTPLRGTVELLPNENFGIVYSPLSEFITSLVKLFQNQEKLNKLGNNGFLYIEKNHCWDKLSDDLLIIFQDIVSKSIK